MNTFFGIGAPIYHSQNIPDEVPQEQEQAPVSKPQFGIMAELAELDAEEANEKNVGWIDFVRSVADGRITDIQVIRASLQRMGRTGEHLEAAMSDYSRFVKDAELAGTRSELERKREVASQAIKAAQQRVTELQSEVLAKRIDLREAETAVQNAEFAERSVASELVEAKCAANRLAEDASFAPFVPPGRENLQSRIAELKRQVWTVTEGWQDARKRLRQLTELEIDGAPNNESIPSLRQQIAHWESLDFTSLPSKDGDMRRKKIDEREGELSRLRFRLAQAERDAESMPDRVKALEVQRDDLQSQLNSATRELSQLLTPSEPD